MRDDLKQIANRIKQCMRDKGLKQVDIVKTTGISKGSVSKWLSGKAKPSGESLIRLSQVLGESESWLLNGKHSYYSYSDFDDSMSYYNSLEEAQKAFYIEKLNIDPKLPYSIRFLEEEFEKKMSSNRLEHLNIIEPDENLEMQLEELIHLEHEDEFFLNKIIQSDINHYSTIKDFVENFNYSNEQAYSQSEFAKRANTNLEKTLFYVQSDHSMEPTITFRAHCSIDLTKRKIINGKLYLVKRNEFFGIRVLFLQSDGSMLLQCKNSDYPNEKIPKTDLDSLDVVGYVYAYNNINPW